MAVYLINESRKLREDFSASFPGWLLKNLKSNNSNSIKSALNKTGVDLNRATFIETDPPRSNRDPMLKDPDKIPIFLLNDGTVYSPKLPSTNNDYVWYIDSEGKQQGDYIKNLSWKKILDITDQFGYIDTTDASNFNKELRQQRKQAKSGDPNLDRKKNAQYKKPVYGNKKADGYTDWDNPSGYQWVTKSGYDKSGYPLDPEKYVRMLNELNLDNYAQKMKRYYTDIKTAQEDLAKAITSADIDNTKYMAAGYWGSGSVFSDIKDAAGYLERAIREYRQIQKTVTFIEKKAGEWDDARRNQYLQDGWGGSSKRLYEYLKEVDEYIQAIITNASYDEED